MAKPIYDGGNIVLIANGLQTSFLTPDLFRDVIADAPLTAFQIPPVAIVDYRRYQATVQPDNRTVALVDKNLNGDGTSLLPQMASSVLNRLNGTVPEAIGFNFFTRIRASKPVKDIVVNRYFSPDKLSTDFPGLQQLGFKAISDCGDHKFQVTVEPVAEKLNELALMLNYHFPLSRREQSRPIIASFVDRSLKVPNFVREIIDAAGA